MAALSSSFKGLACLIKRPFVSSSTLVWKGPNALVKLNLGTQICPKSRKTQNIHVTNRCKYFQAGRFEFDDNRQTLGPKKARHKVPQVWQLTQLFFCSFL